MKILLIISGSIAAYKSLELIRRGREAGHEFTCILTAGGQQFITPMAAAALSEAPCYTDLFSLKDETEMGHIRLSRECDAVLVAPASADLLAKLAQGRADDLASTVLLATDKPVMIAPAMNPKMWEHPATQRNIGQLMTDGAQLIQPDAGLMACGEEGAGRMAEPATILKALETVSRPNLPLSGLQALVTAGPTREAIDPVRYITNHSSGKQGYAIAAALAQAGASVTLVSGPTNLPCPGGVERINVTTAEEMQKACEAQLPADIAICTAAVADWKIDRFSATKLKKADMQMPEIRLIENPDILYMIAHHAKRPRLVIGFAAETEQLEVYAQGKRERKGCDWIIGNDVSEGIFGADDNRITLFDEQGAEAFAPMSKHAVGTLLAERITQKLNQQTVIARSEATKQSIQA